MDEVEVYFGKNNITVKKDINFKELRYKILRKEKRLVKYFIFGNEKINENLSIANYPTFQISLDKSIFSEFKQGQYRCKKCRKYLKLNNLTCRHSSLCRTLYNFKKKESMNEIMDGGYLDKNDEKQNEDFSGFDEEIDNIIDKKIKNYEKKMLDRINEILSGKYNEEKNEELSNENLNNV